MIAPPKCQKSFGSAACQTDHIVLTATPANGRNKNCFWADIVLRAPISLLDTPDSNEDMVSPHSDFNHFRSHILKYDPIVFSLCWCCSASKANIVCHNSNYVECFLKYMLRKGLIFTFVQRRCKVLAGVIVRSPVKLGKQHRLSGNPHCRHHKSNLSSFCAVQDDTVTKTLWGVVYDLQHIAQKLHYVKPLLHFHWIFPLQKSSSHNSRSEESPAQSLSESLLKSALGELWRS